MQHIPEEVVARDLSHALVQVARGVELRFMKPPLGEGCIRNNAWYCLFVLQLSTSAEFCYQ